MSSIVSERVAPPREKLVTWLARLYRHRLTTSSGGNLSIMDEDGTLYITPKGGDKAIVPPANVAVRKKGQTEFTGILPPSLEWPLHTAAYEARPKDCRAVLHAHSMTLVAFSLAHNPSQDEVLSAQDEKKETAKLDWDRRTPDTRCLLSAWQSCGVVALAPYCIPGSVELAQGVADAFKTGANCVIMQNHGVVTIGMTMHEAYDRFVTLEFLARSITLADTIEKPLKLLPQSLMANNPSNLPTVIEPYPTSASNEFDNTRTITGHEKEVAANLCTFIQRAYDQVLITSSSGSFSHRTCNADDELSFLINPTGIDRAKLVASDLCFVSNKFKSGAPHKRSADRSAKHLYYHPSYPSNSLHYVLPSRAARLHATIYETHPQIQVVIVAVPPYATVFCITASPFNSAGIPESYILLHEVETLPLDALLNDNGLAIAKALDPSKGKTTVLVENYGLVTVGTSLLQAFGQMEVCESMCGVHLTAKSRGAVDYLTPAQVCEIDCVFKSH